MVEASHCPFSDWPSSRETVNTIFYCGWLEPTGTRFCKVYLYTVFTTYCFFLINSSKYGTLTIILRRCCCVMVRALIWQASLLSLIHVALFHPFSSEPCIRGMVRTAMPAGDIANRSAKSMGRETGVILATGASWSTRLFFYVIIATTFKRHYCICTTTWLQ